VTPAPQAPNHTPPTEAETRAEWIDVVLARAGWHANDAHDIRKVEALKARYEQSLSDLETLYASLSQQAFNGLLYKIAARKWGKVKFSLVFVQ